MYFPIGWPRVLNVPTCKGQQDENHRFESIVCNRDRVLFAVLSHQTLFIWFCKPCLPITCHTRDQQSIQDFGENALVQWKPDSSMLVVSTTLGYLIFYKLQVDSSVKGIYEQVDSPQPNLCRENVELFTKENIPCLLLSVVTQVAVPGSIPAMVGIRDELMVTSSSAQVWRYKWDGHINRDYCLDLRRIPFCMDQQVSKAVPIVEANTYIVDMEYSPLVGGFSVVFNDGRAAFLTASSLKFDPNQTQGLWAPHLDDARCSALNHKYRLIAFGRANGQSTVYVIDEHTGGLMISHSLIVSDKVYTGELGAVTCMRYTPDGRALALAWSGGGFSMWSTFGTLLACSLAWDYGLVSRGPLLLRSLEWAAEGYQLWMIRVKDKASETDSVGVRAQIEPKTDPLSKRETEVEEDEVMLYSFVKSVLATNPTMSHQSHLFLQGEDKLYINFGTGLSRLYSMSECPNVGAPGPPGATESLNGGPFISSSLIENKQWHVVTLPATYAATNWPIRLAAIDSEGKHLAVAGRCGIAHYSLVTRKWKLFGNETQEKDMVVFGGILWYAKSWVVVGCYSIPTETDEIRFYPKDLRLCNDHVISIPVSGQVFLLESLRNRILTFTSDSRIYIYNVEETENDHLNVTHIQSIDVSGLCVHPACIVSITLTTMRPEVRSQSGNGHNSTSRDSFVMNVSGRLLMVHQFDESQVVAAPTVLASNVETVWVPPFPLGGSARPHVTEGLWLYCGVAGMRVWMPLFPPRGGEGRGSLSGGGSTPGGARHSFISKRIMLPFHLNIYPLGILYEEAILLGVENDAALYSSVDPKSVFSLPFSLLKRTSQVYIHQVLRQLIRRNLGYHAWEIARSCTWLPYFPHSLELLLHEVLEEEATSKEPIPDAQLPSVIEFIQEFPVYLSTIVQCARKTEIALWGYLFAAAGKPKDLFQQCLLANELETAASYLIILQNLESSSVSRQYATLLLEATLDAGKWDLAKDLVRFLKAIDPRDISSSPRTSVIHNKFLASPLPPPNEEDLSMLLGTMQVSRGRSYSTTANPKLEMHQVLGPNPGPQSARTSLEQKTETSRTRKRSSTSNKSDKESNGNSKAPSTEGSASDFYMDMILQRAARRLLSSHSLRSLGHFAAALDFHLVEWLTRERCRAARVDNFIAALKNLHADFGWPYPDWDVAHGRKSSVSSIRSPAVSPSSSHDVFKFSPSVGPVSPKPFQSVSFSSNSYVQPSLGAYSPSSGFHPASSPTGYTSPAGFSQGFPSSGFPANGTGYLRPSTGGYTTNGAFTSPSGFLVNSPSSLIGDSGYMSQDPVLQPHSGDLPLGGGANDVEVRSVMSDNTVVGYCAAPGCYSPTGLVEWSTEVPSTQPIKTEVQLRYLLQLLMEAGCLEWSFIIAVLLRDAMAVHRITNAARAPEQSLDAVLTLKTGFVELCQWSHSECLGYKPFMIAIQAQLTILNKVLALKYSQAPPTSPSPPTPLPRSRSTSGGEGVVGELEREIEAGGEVETGEGVNENQEQAGSCVIS